MNSRKLLKQCFNCKNNISCWHLDEIRDCGKEASKIRIKILPILKWIWGFRGRSLKQFEYSSIRTCMHVINPTMKHDDNLSDIYTRQVMAVLEAHACSQDDLWCCPGEDPESDESFVYEARE